MREERQRNKINKTREADEMCGYRKEAEMREGSGFLPLSLSSQLGMVMIFKNENFVDIDDIVILSL